MQTGNSVNVWEENGWVVRYQPPEDQQQKPRMLLLIHGLTGDENVMWIFTRNLPGNYWLIAPRAPLKAGNGYSWLQKSEDWPNLIEFATPASHLMQGVENWVARAGIAYQAIDVMGFSQGAAMAFALAAFYPKRINRVIALAGYMPPEDTNPGRYHVLRNKSFFIAHGSKDTIVPISMAEDAVQALTAVGARVTFCGSDAGHKLSASCLRGLENFIQAD